MDAKERPWGRRSSRKSPWFTCLASAKPVCFKEIRSKLLDRNALESSVWGAVISVVRSLAFADIHSHRLAMAFALRLAASPSLDARPPRPWGGRSSRKSPWLTCLASAKPVCFEEIRSKLWDKSELELML